MPLWKARLDDPVLDGWDIVGRAVEFPHALRGVIDGIRGAWIAVTRLPDGSWVQDLPGSKVDGLVRLGDDQAHRVLPIQTGVHHRQVGMAHETIGGVKVFKIDARHTGIQDIFPDRVAWTAVGQGGFSDDDLIGQAGQEGSPFRTEVILQPLDRCTRLGIKRVDFDATEGCRIVVSQQAGRVG